MSAVTTPRLHVMVLSIAALAASLSTSYAGVCPQVDARARAAIGPSAPQSIAAQLHYQPTAVSVAAAEARLAAAYGMVRARSRRCRR